MADVNETLAGISAFIREAAQAQHEAWMNAPLDAPDGREWSEFLGKLADRIDAAAKREAATNCNRLREALESFVMEYDRPTFRECECTSCRRVTALVCRAKAALAAPTRNCDKPEFATAEQALAALKRRFPVEEWSGAFRMAVNWLYDTMDYCLALPVSRRFGSSQEGGVP